MAIVGVASVKIKPDLSDFRKELKAGLDSIKAEIQVKVKADLDPARRAIDEFVAKQSLKDITKKVDIDRSSIDRATNALGSLSRSLLDVGKGLVAGSLKVVSFGIKAAAVAAAISAITVAAVGVGHAVAEMIPAGFSVGLGAFLTLATVLGTIKFGMAGIGKALDGLNKPIADLRTAVESSFKASFIPAVNNLKTVIPQLKTPLQEVATAVGGVATKFTAMLKTSENMGLLKTIIENSSKSVQNLGNALAPLGHAFLEIGSVASKIFTDMTKSAGSFAQVWADKITAKVASGELEASFRRSIESVKTFFGTLKDFATGIGNIFKALTNNIGGEFNGGFLDILSNVAKKFKEFTALDSTKQMFSAIGDTIRILSGAFVDLLKALGPVFPVLADTAKIVAENLSKVIGDLAPLIADVAKHFLEIIQQVAPKLVPIIEKIAGGFLKILDAALPLVDPLVGILDALTPLIDPIVRLVQTLIPPLVELMKSLAPVIEAVAKALGKVLDVLGPVISAIITLASIGIGTITDLLGITDGNNRSGSGVSNNALGKAAENIGKDAGNRLGKTFQDEANLTIAHAINDVITLMTGRTNDVGGVAQILGKNAADSLGRGFQTANDQIERIISVMLNSLGLSGPSFAQQGQAISDALGGGMNSRQQVIFDAARAIIEGINAIFNGGKPKAQQSGAEIGNTLAIGLSASKGGVADQAAAVAGVIPGAMGAVSLFSVGARIGQSLASGLNSAISAVRAVLSTITAGIPLWKGPPATDKVLLKPTGIMIMQGLISGITSQQDELQKVLGSVTDQFSSASSSSLAASLSSSIAVSGGLDRPAVQVNVGVNEGPLKDFVNVQIDEGNRDTRRTALTGVR